MRCVSIFLVASASWFIVGLNDGHGQAEKPKKVVTPTQLKSALSQTVPSKPYQNALPIRDALGLLKEHLALKKKELPIVIDQKAFWAETPDSPDIVVMDVKLSTKKDTISAEGILREIISQIPTQNAALVVRAGYVEITTKAIAKKAR